MKHIEDGVRCPVYFGKTRIGYLDMGQDLRRTYMCVICGAPYFHKETLVRHHRRLHNLPGGYTCQQCSSVFGQKGDLNRHKLNCFNYQAPGPSQAGSDSIVETSQTHQSSPGLAYAMQEYESASILNSTTNLTFDASQIHVADNIVPDPSNLPQNEQKTTDENISINLSPEGGK